MRKQKILGLCTLISGLVLTSPSAIAQNSNSSKPAAYTYLSEWATPREKWGEMEKMGVGLERCSQAYRCLING